VYLAHDRKHERPVALKVLLPQIAATLGTERFLREIRVAARLTHPLILPLLDSGEVDGLPFFVMPYVQGETLHQRIERSGRLGIDEAIGIARDVADALDYAHAVGIVHRDIKPDNVLLLANHGIVADFGIARAMHSAVGDHEVTSVGMAVGTPSYISPEQALAEADVDGRSDLYSLAAVLYEMLTGVPPFVGPNAQSIIAKRFLEQPRPVRELREDVPAGIEAIVAQTLAMDRDDRPARASDFLRALTTGAPRAPRAPSAESGPAAAAPSSPSRATPDDAASIAVMPFENSGADPALEYLCDGISEEIIDTLSRMRTIRVVGRTSSFAFKQTKDDTRTIGTRLGVANILEGSVRRHGEQLRITARLVQAATGYQLWSSRFDRPANDVMAVQDEIGQAIAQTLEVTIVGEISRSIRLDRPSDEKTQEAFLEGRFYLNKRTEESIRQAAVLFQTAIDKDPGYAPGHAALADALVLLGIYGASPPNEVMSLARQAAARALEIDPTLAAAHATLGVIRALFDWDWPGAADAFHRAIAINPRYPTARQWYAMNYLVPQRQFEEAMRQIERAQSLDPLSLAIRATAGVVHHLSGNFIAAAAVEQKVLEADASFAMAHYFLASAYRDMGAADRALESFDRAIALGGGSPEMLAGRVQAFLCKGDVEAADRAEGELHALARTRYVAPSLFAQIAAARGDGNRAFEWLARAAEARDGDLIFLNLRPSYRSLSSDPRFESLRLKIGLP
jgi:serine/threonine-protein kinase